MSSLNDRVTALSPEKRALLEQRLWAKKTGVTSERIRPRNQEIGPPPLSYAQQRLWFLEQLEPGHSFYNLPFTIRLLGTIWVPALEKSLNEIVRRHESLRTRFATTDGRPVQIIAPEMTLSLQVIDLCDTPESEREEETPRHVFVEGQRPFDLQAGPLLRASLLRLSNTEHVLMLTMHHIVSDGWSMGVLYRELSALYEAFSAGRPSPLQELPIQYADFAIWQREWLSGGPLNHLRAYWTKALSGMPALLELPTDRPRPRMQAFHGASYSVVLPKSLVEGLKTIGRQVNATLFMTLLAAFKTLLFRYSGQSDMIVGAPIANRTRVELENLIGFFVNTLVLRTDLSGNPTFLELLVRVREVTLAAYAHQDMPFEKLVEELQPARDLSYNPLFQVMFVLQNTETRDVQIEPQHNLPQFSVGTSRFDLTLCALETVDGLMTVFEYNTTLFDDSTIISMSENFKVLLESAVSDPEQRIRELLPLSESERRRLLVEYNQTAGDDTGATLIHEFCETRAALRPEGIALTFCDGQLTYHELNSRSNQLARYLRERGVGPGVLVGICAERSPEMITAILGVLKAGGAFLPLDPAYPLDRLEYMLEDSRIQLVLTQERLVASLPAYSGEILLLDADWSHINDYDGENLESLATPDDLAYVIYTSGSTGRPKGVMVPHRGVVNVAKAQTRKFALREDSRVLQFASLNFDASVFEIVMALSAGSQLHLAMQESILPGSPLIKVLRDEKINVLTIPPSSLAVLPSTALPDLHTLIVAGEACPAELLTRWAYGRQFFNAYGPTEASIWSTVAECAYDQTTITIGRPILNTQVYVLNDGLEPIPVGVPGELYIGGAGVARGYLNRPDLTAERFVPDPFSIVPGARLYRTGDLARHLGTGDIQFLGRIDHQLKLRGYRIEPGEIEASLLLHEEIQEAAVIPRLGLADELHLAAYYVSTSERAPDVAELRDFLRQRLPSYMIPTRFSRLDALPLNANGKLDRQALAALGEGEALPDDKSVAAPRNATEEILAGIWHEVLGVDHAGINDDFFDHGGHSLLATRFMSRVNDAFDVSLPLRDLFEWPTIAKLAESVDLRRRGEARSPGAAIELLPRQLVKLPVAPESLATVIAARKGNQ